jgi:hypothetical protein
LQFKYFECKKVFGHGAKTPFQTYPMSNYNISFWSNFGGLDQLTKIGLLQSYFLGQNLKNYYIKFLTSGYKPSNVYVRSVDYDKSLMASNAFLSGMYPVSSEFQIWSDTVTWYPIPVHTNNKDNDQIFIQNCPKYNDLLEESIGSPQNEKIELENEDLVRQIENLSGYKPLTYFTLNIITEAILAELNNNLILLEWARNNFAQLLEASNYAFNLRYGTIEKARLKSGSKFKLIQFKSSFFFYYYLT